MADRGAGQDGAREWRNLVPTDEVLSETSSSRWTQTDAGIDCMCGGRMVTHRLDGTAFRTRCPDCDRQPIDLMTKADP